ncbi:Undecaprenyl-phosphate galactose phosphotransferase [Parafrankia sp. EAN1pec]|nr:Undecaprenyl-phosphate galactose phosphotransferase [Frankia sp. EAN1pec]
METDAVPTVLGGDAPVPAIPRQRCPDEWPAAGSQRWKARLCTQLVVIDTLAIVVAIVCAYLLRFGIEAEATARGMWYLSIGTCIALAWLVMLGATDAYATRYLGVGTEEYRRISVGTFRLWGATTIGCYVLRAEVARGFCLIALPLGLLLLLTGRALARLRLVSVRRTGHARHRVVVVGDSRSVLELVGEFHHEPAAGFDVIGVCVPKGARRPDGNVGAPVLGSLEQVSSVVAATGADTVVVTSSASLDIETAKGIAWELEGTGVDLVVAPPLGGIAGPRVSLRPVAGLPLLHVEEPVFTGWRKFAKNMLDRALAAVALVVLCPLLLAVVLLIRFDSSGPALFRQTRTGKDGRDFEILKFRTMYVDAEQRRAVLENHNEADGLLFKIRDDPRVTRVGRTLRRLSVDELPQFVNVLRGEMSLVGPRPPLPSEVARYSGPVHRRLKVKPGLTGLWQVSGRSELPWRDAVRLDLYYVENWSIMFDLIIILRTVRAVLGRSGAF